HRNKMVLSGMSKKSSNIGTRSSGIYESLSANIREGRMKWVSSSNLTRWNPPMAGFLKIIFCGVVSRDSQTFGIGM
ncbi:unnamed protein product, partial [Ilex paraguariensis]